MSPNKPGMEKGKQLVLVYLFVMMKAYLLEHLTEAKHLRSPSD